MLGTAATPAEILPQNESRNPPPPDVTKCLPKQRESGGMDGMNNHSLDFFETDSSEAEDQASQDDDRSPKSLAQDKSRQSSSSSRTRLDRSEIPQVPENSEAFDFALSLPDDAGTAFPQNTNVESQAASFTLNTQSEARAVSPALPSARTVYEDPQQYPEYFQPFEQDESRRFMEDRDLLRWKRSNTSTDPQEIVATYTEGLKRHIGDQNHSPTELDELLVLYSMTLQTILQRKGRRKPSRDSKHSKRPASPKRPKGIGNRGPPRAEGVQIEDVPPTPSSTKSHPLPSRPAGILRNPSFGGSTPSRPVHTTRRSQSGPNPNTGRPPVPTPPPPPINTNVARHVSIAPQVISQATEDRPYDSLPLPTPYPPPRPAREDEAPLLNVQPTATPGRSASVRILDPSAGADVDGARRATLASRRRSSAINTAAVTADTILALSVRRRHGPNGRRFVRLVVPADEEIATPAQSRRKSTLQGRKRSVATTDPEKSQEAPEPTDSKPKVEFDDAAFFRELRKAYFTQLLGSTWCTRAWRRYLSAYTLKRITLTCEDGVADPDPPSITPATRSTRILTRRGFNDVESEESLLRHFLVPNLGRASWRWVRWVHRVGVTVDEDNADFEARMRKVSIVPAAVHQISAVPGGLEFVEGPGVGRLLGASMAVVGASLAAVLAYVGAGPLGVGAMVLEALTQGQVRMPSWDAEGRVVEGILMGQFVFWVAVGWLGLWVWISGLMT